jgi:hemerythrin-like domain-containing protein
VSDQKELDRLGCDTSEMLMVHRLFRRLFGEAPDLIRRVPDSETERIQHVGDHLLLIVASLHGHHRSEDTLLWDQLSSRAPSCAIHVGLMRRQHAEIGHALDALETAVPAWRAAPSASTREPVLAALDAVLAGLGQHLGDEERLILPPVGETFTQREWNRLGERARAETPRSMQFVQLGFLLDALEPAERAEFERQVLPTPARVLYRLVGQRQYRNYRRKVYGTAA